MLRTTLSVALLAGCASTPPVVTIEVGSKVGVSLAGPAPAVDFPSPTGNAGVFAASGVLLGVLAAIPTLGMSLVVVPGESAKAATKEVECTTSFYEGRPNLAQQIDGIVERGFDKKMVIDPFLAQIAARTDITAIVLQSPSTTNNLTHEAAVHQAKEAGVDVLFEFSPTKISFFYGSGIQNYDGCRIRPLVRLKYQVTRVVRDEELAVSYLSARSSGSSEPGAQTIGRWLAEPSALSGEIAEAYAAAIETLWYGAKGSPRYIFPGRRHADGDKNQ